MSEKICGIYCIENIIDGKKYIGKTTDLKDRWRRHKSELSGNRHANKYLQRIYNKYGMYIFNFYVLQELPLEEKILANMEIYWIAYYNSYAPDGGGYNLTRGGEGCRGNIHTEATKNILRKKRLMQKDPRLGTKHTDERKKMWSEKRKGGSGCLGYKFTEEQRKHLSEVHMGISPNNKGKTYQVNTKYKNSSSKYFGVNFVKSSNKWACRLKYFGKEVNIGLFYDEIEAAIAYNEAEIEFYGTKAKLNEISEEEYNSVMINS
jgi:group I intron endonuclease